jgi:hypothetical protein
MTDDAESLIAQLHSQGKLTTPRQEKFDIKLKGAGIFLHELQLYDSSRQKCSILDTLETQGLQIQEWE